MLDYPRWKTLLIIGVAFFFCLAALPNLLSDEQIESLPSWLPKDKMNLGLDLRGGSHLLMEVDFKAYQKDQFNDLRDEVRDALRKDGIGYTELKANNDSVQFTIRPETLPEGPSIVDRIRKIDPELETETNAADQNSFVVRYNSNAVRTKQFQLIEQSMEIIDRRINETGTKEPTIQRQGEDRILVQVPGVDNPQQLKAVMGKTAKMSFHLVNESVTPTQIAQGIVPPGTRLLPSDDPTDRNPDGTPIRYAVQSAVALSGELLTNANPSFNTGQAIVEFTFNSMGARKFGEITQANIGKRFAVVLDNKVITAPVIRSAILGGKGMIEGNFTAQSANELAILLRAGALPAPLNVIEERSVGPSLGADSIEAGKTAITISVIAVLVYMMWSYSLFGVFAVMGLVINVVMMLGILSLFGATLTMPGIAGIALTIGMAVDANTLIFERIREELRNGKGMVAAITSGFKMAFGTIIDSNLTTLLAAYLLFHFGSGSVKGFAVTLSIGILTSMFTAVLVTRLIIATWFRAVRPKKLPV